MEININENFLNSLNQGKTGSFNGEGIWHQDGWIQKLARMILLGYAQERDAKLANQITHRMKVNISSLRATDPVSEELKKLNQAGNAFMKRVLSKHSLKRKTTKVAMEKLQQRLNTCKIANRLKLSPNTVSRTPGFQDAVLRNHLHNRINQAHQDAGVGVTEEEGNIYFYERDGESKKATRKIWHEVVPPTGLQNKELLAYGWETIDNSSWDEVKPFKVISVDDSPTNNRPGAELVTVPPSYSLANLGLGTFGHTYIRFYKPILNENKEPTGQVEVYSIGYNLDNITLPDKFEHIPRKPVTTAVSINDAKLGETLEMINKLNKLHKAHKSHDEGTILSMEKEFPELKELYRKAMVATCANFGSSLFDFATGKKISGRARLVRILNPEKIQPAFDWLWDHLPSFISNQARRPQFMTRGYFPEFMAKRQRRTNIKAQQAEARRQAQAIAAAS